MARLFYTNNTGTSQTLNQANTTNNLDSSGKNVWTQKFPALVSRPSSVTGNGLELITSTTNTNGTGLFYNGERIAAHTGWVDVSSYLTCMAGRFDGSLINVTPTYAYMNLATFEIMVRMAFPVAIANGTDNTLMFMQVGGVTNALDAHGVKDSHIIGVGFISGSMGVNNTIGQAEVALASDIFCSYFEIAWYFRVLPGTTTNYYMNLKIQPIINF